MPQESVNSTYDLSEQPIPFVEKLLDFLYTGDYPADVDATKRDLSMSVLQLHVEMFNLGDQYDIPLLRDLAARKYSDRLAWGFKPLEYLDSIPRVFFSRAINSEKLKDAAVQIPFDKLKSQLKKDSVRAKYEKVTTDCPEFAKRMLDYFLI